MSFWERMTRSNFLIRLRSWEYWPFGIIHIPAILYWIWLSARARSFVFFSASNPGIPMGGMFGESKYQVLKQIPCQYIPKTILVSQPIELADVRRCIRSAGMRLPVICKPDIGERGYLVKRIANDRELKAYLREIRGGFLVQELVDLPLEFGVFYMRMPTDVFGRVTSIVGKEMLTVTGDGKAQLHELIYRNDRAKLQWKKLRELHSARWRDIIPKGEKIELVSIGNHAQGTRFIDASNLINERLSATFDAISCRIDGFYYGRFDLRCASIADLCDGNVKIMELNGCGAEPAHIYDTDFSLWQAMRTLVLHWENIFRISRENRKRGIRYVTHRHAWAYYRKFKSAVK